MKKRGRGREEEREGDREERGRERGDSGKWARARRAVGKREVVQIRGETKSRVRRER